MAEPTLMNKSCGREVTMNGGTAIDYGDGLVFPVFDEPMEEHPHPGMDALIAHAEFLRELYRETPEERLAQKCNVRFVM